MDPKISAFSRYKDSPSAITMAAKRKPTPKGQDDGEYKTYFYFCNYIRAGTKLTRHNFLNLSYTSEK